MRLRRSRERRPRQPEPSDLTPQPSVFSSRARRAGETLPQAIRQTGLSWLQRLGLIVLMAAVLISLVNMLTLSNDVRVVPLSTTGSRLVLRPTSAYQQAASHDLSRSIWSHNKITVNTNQVSWQLLAQFPELNSVSITVPLLAHQPVVYIEPAQPTLILVTGDNSAYIIGSTGKALLAAATPAAFNQPKLPVVNDQSGLQVKLNHQALSGDSVHFIQTVVGELAAKQFSVADLTLPAGSSELDAHLTGQPYVVKFNLQSDDPRGEAGTFLATIAQLKRQNVTPASYVDVRVNGRAYYK